MDNKGGHFTSEEVELITGTIQKLEIGPGSIVKLTIPMVGNRWNSPRISKLAKAVRDRGGELAVVRDDGTKLEIG